MTKEEKIKSIVEIIAREIRFKEILTYGERDEWEQFLTDIIDNIVEQENKQLKERVDYLERSNNRREDEIISLRQELIDKEENIDSAIEYIENTPTIYSSEKKTCKDLLEILKGGKNEKRRIN